MRTGICARTGQVLTGWDHCAQLIRLCLVGMYGSEVMRRHIGSDVRKFQDDNADSRTIFRLFVAISEALSDPDGGEPGFRLTSIALVSASRAGRFAFLLTGIYFPRGHLGDFSIREPRDLSWAGGIAA